MSNIRKPGYVFESQYDSNWRYVSSVRLREGEYSGWDENKIQWSSLMTKSDIKFFMNTFKEASYILKNNGLEKLMNCEIRISYRTAAWSDPLGFYSGVNTGDRMLLTPYLISTGEKNSRYVVLHELGHRFYGWANKLTNNQFVQEVLDKYDECAREFRLPSMRSWTSFRKSSRVNEFWAECWAMKLENNLPDPELERWTTYMIDKYKPLVISRLPG